MANLRANGWMYSARAALPWCRWLMLGLLSAACSSAPEGPKTLELGGNGEAGAAGASGAGGSGGASGNEGGSAGNAGSGNFPGAGGSSGSGGKPGQMGGAGGSENKPPPSGKTLADAVDDNCTTAVIKGLSEQLVAEVNCLKPGTLTSIEGMQGVSMGQAVLPWLQTSAANALAQAAKTTSVAINSATRALPQQLLLYRWYQQGRCGITLAAKPGTSNHERGLAVDIQNYAEARPAMASASYQWLGGNDPWHFDYIGGGSAKLTSLSVQAFQRLCNLSEPGETIAEDGEYGPATETRLLRAPIEGFQVGPTCQNLPAAWAPDATELRKPPSICRGGKPGAVCVNSKANRTRLLGPASLHRRQAFRDFNNPSMGLTGIAKLAVVIRPKAAHRMIR